MIKHKVKSPRAVKLLTKYLIIAQQNLNFRKLRSKYNVFPIRNHLKSITINNLFITEF